MSDVTATPETPAAPDSRSSIFEKTSPELRRKLERAILNYDPASYLAIFKKYDLPAHGVSYTSFYCYARKLRTRASVHQAVDFDGPDDDSLVEALPRLIAQFLVDQIMANDATGADTIYRLTLAHRAALENAALARKHRAAQSAIHDSAAESDAALLAEANRVLAAQQARLADDEAKALARFEQAKKDFTAMGYPVAHCKTHDEVEEILRNTEPTQLAAPAPISGFQFSNPEISNPRSPNPDNPVNPVHLSSDLIVSTADDQFRISPEERRRRECHRVMIAYGLLKPDAPLPDSS